MLENNSKEPSSSVFARENKVRTLHDKFVVFIIALILFVGWTFFSNIWNGYLSSKNDLLKQQQTYDKKQQQQKEIVQDLNLLKQVGTADQKNSLIQCYNTNCSNLPQELQKSPTKDVFKTYLQLQTASQSKFTIDQKKLLTYLNEFLIKSSDGTINGDIKGIAFGSPVLGAGLVTVPVSVTVTFPNKQSLLGFLHNVEQLISPTFPMFAIVQSVNYDIVKSDSAQDVVVSMNIYMVQ